MHEILIIGGGFAGVWSALGAAAARRALGAHDSSLRIGLLTREPYLTIRPRLYESNPQDARVPLRELLDSAGVELILGDAARIDAAARTVVARTVPGLATLRYDRLILAAGSRLRPPRVPGAESHVFNVDTYAEAMVLESHLRGLADGPARPGRFTAVVVGAGFAGLEVATTMVSRLESISSRVAGGRPSVVLVEHAGMVAPDLGANPRPFVESALRDLGISLRTRTDVAAVHDDYVTLSTGEHIPAATTVWTAGLSASDLTLQLPAERDSLGRVTVDSHLRVRGVDGVLAAGDTARAMADDEHVAPMSCQYAIPMGDLAGRNAVAELTGREPRSFRPPPYVTCLDLGNWGALFTQGWDREVHLSGFWGKTMKETINTRLIYPAGRSGDVGVPAPARPTVTAAA
jgi:NADH dehydrogenase